jgi:hypothetical protein
MITCDLVLRPVLFDDREEEFTVTYHVFLSSIFCVKEYVQKLRPFLCTTLKVNMRTHYTQNMDVPETRRDLRDSRRKKLGRASVAAAGHLHVWFICVAQST